jgi:hypothetical protein
MGSRNGIPLDRSAWLHRMEGLGCAIAGACSGQNLFAAPVSRPCRTGAGSHLAARHDAPDRRRVEAAISAGALESAALFLMGDDSGFCLSRGADGRPLASVLLPYQFEECTSGGASLGLACLARWSAP